MTLRQVEKVLRKAGVKYSNVHGAISIKSPDRANVWIGKDSEYLTVILDNHVSMESIIKPFKFNSLTSDGDSLYFSFKGENPLIVKIK